MSRSDNVYLLDIIESIDIIDRYIGTKIEFDFTNDMMMQDAVFAGLK